MFCEVLLTTILMTSIFLEYNCTDDDYKFWSPGSGPLGIGSDGVRVPCLLGRTETYQRRLPHSNCYNSRNYVRRVKMEVCGCDAEDFDWYVYS